MITKIHGGIPIQDERNEFIRKEALQMAIDLVGKKIFNPETQNDLKPSDVAEFYDIAEYNYRFIIGKELNIDARSSTDRKCQERQERTAKALANV